MIVCLLLYLIAAKCKLLCSFYLFCFPQERIGDVRDLPWTERSSKEEVECHKEIAAYVREHVLKLEAVARREYYGNNPDTCPYSTAE